MREAGFYWIEWKDSKIGKDVAHFDGKVWFFINNEGEMPREYVETYYNIGPKISEPEELCP